MNQNNYQKLEVYQKSYHLALEIHKFTMKLPKELPFDLADQIRRSTRSIPANIAEGYGKRIFPKEFKKYLWNAVGSKDETIVHLNFLKDLEYVKEDKFQYFIDEYEKIGRMLFGLIKTIN